MNKKTEQRFKDRAIGHYLIEQNEKNNGYSPEAKAAIERCPELGYFSRTRDVLTIAKNLDALPGADRNKALDRLRQHDSDVVGALAEMPPMPERADRLRADAPLANLIEHIEQHSTLFDLAAERKALRLVRDNLCNPVA